MKTTPFLLALLLPALASAQKGQLVLTAGPAIPLGAFAATHDENREGYARTGWHLGAAYERARPGAFGWALSAGVQVFGLDRETLAAQYGRMPFYQPVLTPGPGPAPSPYKTLPGWTVRKDSWIAVHLMGGVTRELRLGPGWTLNGKALVGAALLSPPALQGAHRTDSTEAYLTRTAKNAFGLAYSVQAGLCRSLSARSFLHLGAGYSGTGTVRFSTQRSSFERWGAGGPTGGAASSSSTGSMRQQLSSGQVSLGVGLRL
ncbi:MAG: hypothetical protein EOO11_04145 [Chitinophagaceae bacterium]|nr:MAG: hypothetical protein EOO11_04145 [Chitinophagaceae bacterium]